MRILFFITSMDVGGAERQVLDLAQRLGASGHQVKIAYLTGDGVLLSEHMTVDSVGFHAVKTFFGFMKSFFLLRRTILEFEPYVVHSHMVHANLLARLVRCVTNIPKLCCTAHNTNEGGALRMFAYRLTNFLADITTNVSYDGVKAFEEKKAVHPGFMKVVPNGIDTDKFHFDPVKRIGVRAREGILPSDKVILAVGRLVEAKGYFDLFRAFSSICSTDLNVSLWIIGGGELDQNLVAFTEELKISKRVKFYGIRNDVADFYCAADLYVLSSLWEGFGLVVAEAMATERLVVATDCGGVKDVLGNQGILVPPGNVHELLMAMRLGLEMDGAAAQKIGAVARQRVIDNYSLDMVVKRWVEIYES